MLQGFCHLDANNCIYINHNDKLVIITLYVDDLILYCKIIGSLMFLMVGTYPGLAAAVSIISQYATKPLHMHLHTAKHVLCYVKGTASFKLHIGGNHTANSITLASFADADWGSS